MGKRGRAWLALGAVVAGGAGVMTVAVATPSEEHRPAAASPVKTHSVKLQSQGRGRHGVERRDTEPFSLLGISWPRSDAGIDGRAEVRTRSTGTGEWGPWHELGTDLHAPEHEEGREDRARGATEPRWVGPSDGVEARVVSDDGRTAEGLPDGMRLDLVDPGVTPREAKRANAAGARPAAPGADMEPAAFVAEDPLPLTSGSGTTGTSTAPQESPAPSDSSSPTASGTTDPSAGTGDSPSPTASGTTDPSPTATRPTAPESTVNRPRIVSRAEWGADESLVEEPSEYLEGIDAAFVHHTTDANGYTCAQSPAIIRAIMAYHVESNGWNDLGYNFLVDKCGTIYEGRHGGVDLPVRGAHTYGFNGYSTGIAVIGNFAEGGVPGTRVLDAVSRVSAWKLGQYGVDPEGRVTMTAAADTGVWNEGDEATLYSISGHRDGFATACPGQALYDELPDVRRFAGSPAVNSAPPTADFDRDGLVDMAAGMPRASVGGDSRAGAAVVVPGGVDGPVAEARIPLSQSSPGVAGGSEPGDAWASASAYGDVNGDGHADLAVGAPGEDNEGLPDSGAVTLLYGPDFTTSTWIEPAAGERTDGGRFGSTVAVGDFDSDGTADVFTASGGAPAGWWSYDVADDSVRHGDLRTGASGSVSHLDSTTGDFDRDGYADVVLNHRDAGGDGRLTLLKGSADGLVYGGLLSTPGGRSVDAGDIDGDRYADLVVGQAYTAESGAHSGGQITVLPGSPDGPTTTGRTVVHQNTSGVPGGAEAGDAMGYSVAVGDVDGDGHADVLAGLPREDLAHDGTSRKDAGMVVLLYGTSAGLGTSGAEAYHQNTSGISGVAESGDRFGSAVQLADLSGWGRTDLAIGVDGENSGDGTVLQLDAGSAGVDPSGGVYYNRDDVGTAAGARLGEELTP